MISDKCQRCSVNTERCEILDTQELVANVVQGWRLWVQLYDIPMFQILPNRMDEGENWRSNVNSALCKILSRAAADSEVGRSSGRAERETVEVQC